MPEHLATAQKRLEAIERAKAELEAEAREKAQRKQAEQKEKAEKQGKTHRARSRIMKDSDKAFVQGYNAQAAVDAEPQIIMAADLTNQAGDSSHLPGQVEQVKHNTGRKPKDVSADAGYYSDDNVRYLKSQRITAFIPPDKVKHSEWRDQKSPRGRIPKDMALNDRMRCRLNTKCGRERYKLRQTSVEPTFGHIK